MSDHRAEVVQTSTPGTWNVICTACSDKAQDYVYPCVHVDEQVDAVGAHWPPAQLYEARP